MEMKGFLPPVHGAQRHGGVDTQQPQGVQGASKRAMTCFTLLHATKAFVAQGVAYGVMIGARMIARELLEAARNSSEKDLGTAAILSAAAVGTFVFDQLCTKRAVSMVYGWLKKDGSGAPGQPVGSKTGIALALLPTALSGLLLAREVYGTSENGTLLAVDLASMMIGWRAGRLTRDMIQQLLAQYLRKLTIVDADTGKPLTHQQKKTFDDARLGYQLTGYTATVFLGAFVTTPVLRGYLGNDERAGNATDRLYAMLAPMINSMLVEAFDEVISPFVQSIVAPRQNLVIKVDPGERPKDLGKAILDQGSMRAFMGVFVTDLAQLILSIDRGGDFIKSLGTAVGSVATSIMEIRAKSVGVQSGLRDRTRAFKDLTSELVRSAQFAAGRRFSDEEKNTLRHEIRKFTRELVQAGLGSQAIERTGAMSHYDLYQLTPKDDGQVHKAPLHFKQLPAIPPMRGPHQKAPPQSASETKSEVRLDIAPTRTSEAGHGVIHPVSASDPGMFDTKRGPSALTETESPEVHIHPSPIKHDKHDLPVKPASPRPERESAATAHEPTACRISNAAGKCINASDIPSDSSILTLKNFEGREITGTVATDVPPEPGFVHLITPYRTDMSDFGQRIHRMDGQHMVKIPVI